MELYIYYRVRACDAPALRAAVQALQAELIHDHPGLQARLLVRCDAPAADRSDPEQATWMETYTHPDGIDAVLQQRIEARARLLPGMPAARHTEAFRPCA